MPLPADDTAWPPPQEAARYDRMRTTSTWYGGDPDKLSALYLNGGTSAEVVVDGLARKVVQAVRRFFWGSTTQQGERSTKIHVPVAEDIATRSSELLFAEGIKVRVDGPVEPEDVYQEEPVDPTEAGIPGALAATAAPKKTLIRAKGEPTEATKKAQERLDAILDRANFQALLLAAAETQSPLGSTALRVAWNKQIEPEMPFLTRADADSVVTEYEWGRLVSVTFWRTIENKGETRVRHLERHERGMILHGVYKGTYSNLGKRQPLAAYPETAELATQVNAEGAIVVDPKYRFATSIPNMLPDPLDRQNAAGRSDLTPAVIGLMDAIDETVTSLMRDIELAKGRLVVADYMLNDNGPGKGSTFNPETKVYSPLRMTPSEEGADPPITIVQFQIRVEEHIRAAEWLIYQALKAAGYNSDTQDGAQGGDMTATEYSGRGKRSLSTRDKKIAYWQNALEDVLEALLAADAKEFNSGIQVFPVKVEFPDAVQPDLRMLAETVELMKRASAASTQVIVETLHPDWSAQEVQEEVERIEESSTLVDPNTFGLSPTPPALTPTPPGQEPTAGLTEPPAVPGAV